MLTSKANKTPVMMDIAEGNVIRPYMFEPDSDPESTTTGDKQPPPYFRRYCKSIIITITSMLHVDLMLTNLNCL